MSPVIAIAGGTGHIGQYVTAALLASVPKPVVRLLTRTKSEKAEEFAKQGAELRIVDYKDAASVAAAVEGADVFISTIGTKEAGKDVKEQLMKTILGVESVKVIIPSEFGIDHRLNDFEQPDWAMKKNVVAVILAQDRIKAVSIYTGLFLEDSFGPWFGMSIKDRKFEVIGPDVPVTFTSLGDVGRATAVAALTPVSEYKDHAYLRISGDAISLREAAAAFSAVSGDEITVVNKDVAEYKAEVLKNPAPNAAHCLRFIMGEGKLNLSTDSANEFVNPGEKKWKWKTVKDFAEEVGVGPSVFSSN